MEDHPSIGLRILHITTNYEKSINSLHVLRTSQKVTAVGPSTIQKPPEHFLSSTCPETLHSQLHCTAQNTLINTQNPDQPNIKKGNIKNKR
jgi:hypothetical protein